MKTHLTQGRIDRLSTTKSKENFFDTELRGFSCEAAASGRKTFNVMFHDEYGRQRQKKVGDAALMPVKEARAKAGEMLLQVARGGATSLCEGHGLRDCPTFAEFVATRYMPHAKATKRSWKCDDSLLRTHLLPMFGKKILTEIRLDDVQAFYQRSVENGSAQASTNRRMILLRYIFNLALKWEVHGVTKNPASAIKLPNPRNEQEHYLSAEETTRLQRMVERSRNRMLRFIIPALLLTGMRKREVLDAKWENLDLVAKTYYLPGAATKSCQARTVQLSNSMIQLLQSVPHRPDCPFIFANPDTGKPFVSIYASWNMARIKAGLPEVRIHDLRHTFASLLINGSYELYDVMKALGHTQISTTMRYAHLTDKRKREAVNAVAKGCGLMPVLPG
jgi:integrase